MEDENRRKMFGPLNFKDYQPEDIDEALETPCILCDDQFNLKICFDVFLKHLFEVHKVVIEDVQNIYNLGRYLRHWKDRFKKSDMTATIPAISIDATDEKYFLLSTLLKEDKELRHRLTLDKAIHTQEKERTDHSYHRECLFCRFDFKGNRYDYINHLSEQHNLHLGSPQNLVFIDELIETIDAKLNSLLCLYCERQFYDRTVLKEHMRKKLHKSINPKNKTYDRFYIVNYLEDDRRLCRYERDDSPIDENCDTEYEDWLEGEDTITCLFCEHTEFDFNKLCLHMHTLHRFNFAKLTAHLDFYQRVKLVNYIRRQIHGKQCPFCNHEERDVKDLYMHMKEAGHCDLPETEKYEQPEYYFPTYENDSFLCFLEDLD